MTYNIDFYRCIDSELCEAETTYLHEEPHPYKSGSAHRLFAASRKMAFGEASIIAMEIQFQKGMCEQLHKLGDPWQISEIMQPDFHKCKALFHQHRKQLFLVVKVKRDTTAAELEKHLQQIKSRLAIDGYAGIRINENGFVVEATK